MHELKKKVLIKTIFDICKGIMVVILNFCFIAGGLYLLIFIPIWFMELFDLVEIYGETPAGIVYLIEAGVYLAIYLIFRGVHTLYQHNLREMKGKSDGK